MNKVLKRILIFVLIAALTVGAVFGGLVLFRNAQKKPVNVYAVRDFAMTDYWGDSSQTGGMVTTDKLQDVYISGTQKVNEIYVQEGQTVKVGDPLLAYDTTLSDIDLEKADIDLQKLKLQMETAQKELQEIISMRPNVTVLITPEPLGIEYITQPTPSLISGEGTEDDPFYYLWGEDDALDAEFLMELFPKKPEEGEGSGEQPEPDTQDGETEGDASEGEQPEEKPINYDESYVVLITRMYDALNAPITDYWGLKLDKSSGKLTFRFYDPVLSEEIQKFETEPEPYYESYGSVYSAAELAEMRSSKEQEIKDLEVAIKLSQVAYDQLQQEVNNGVVLSTVDGTVKSVLDPDEASAMGMPVVQVSGGGGYIIDVTMSELELDTVTVGQTVTVLSWESYTEFEGVITEISEYPITNGNSWSDGNTNVSYYPFRVFVDESAQLRANEYVEITYRNTVQEGDSLYLENQFIRTENGKSYVYVRTEDGTLERRTIQTGKNLWGNYTQIRGGLTVDDYVAFPYGKDVVDGAETIESTIEEFYGW